MTAKSIQLTEGEIVAGLRAGNHEVFDLFVKENLSLISGICWKLLGSSPEVEDVIQDVFVKVWRKIDTFKGKSKFSTWLYRLAVNECLMRIRSKRARPVEVCFDDYAQVSRSLLAPPGAGSPASQAENQELGWALEKAIGALKEKDKGVVLMCIVKEWSNAETAKYLGISVPAIKSRLYRGRLKLQRHPLLRQFVGVRRGAPDDYY